MDFTAELLRDKENPHNGGGKTPWPTAQTSYASAQMLEPIYDTPIRQRIVPVWS